MDVVIGFFLLLALPVVVFFVFIYLLKTIRTKSMKSFAKTIGFSFAIKKDESFFSEFSKFRLFSIGHAKKIRNILDGKKENYPISIFDYIYRDIGMRSKWHKHTVISFCSDKLSIPTFVLRPKAPSGFLVGFEAFAEIEFDESKAVKIDSNEIFNKSYLLQGDNEAAVRSLFNSDVLRFFEKEKKWYAEGSGNKLIFCSKERGLKTKQLKVFLEKAYHALTMFANRA